MANWLMKKDLQKELAKRKRKQRVSPYNIQTNPKPSSHEFATSYGDPYAGKGGIKTDPEHYIGLGLGRGTKMSNWLERKA